MKSQPDNNSQYQIITTTPQKLQWLPFGEIKPTGWLREQMQKDLNGFVGRLNELVPDLMADSIYGKDRLTKSVKAKNVGNIGIEMDPQYLWWNSETQSNWRDGYIRNSILLGDKNHLKKNEQYVAWLISTQDADGYLGVYSKDLRYNFPNENGELWAKTTALRGLLAWYEFTRNQQIMVAIQKTVADVMRNYPVNASHPFKSDKPFAGGLTHGLMFTDILDRMYQLTGDKSYLDYALFLYKDFSENILREDVQYPKIVDTGYRLKEHGVHTYEHLRSLTAAWFASGNPALKKALDIYLRRIDQCTTPSGGPIGDEWVGGRIADATNTGYEYCSIHELLDGYCNLFQKTAENRFGDKAELLFFNAAQGARHPEQSAIAYCKTDNSWQMTGAKNGEPNEDGKQTRFKYSPAHQDVAVCCVPNAGRITPYYIKAMWMKDDEGLVATLHGPSEVETTIKNTKVRIAVETDYPLGFTIDYRVMVNQPAAFVLKIRKPDWAKKISANFDYTEKEGFLIINRTWKNKTDLHLEFHSEIVVREDQQKAKYFTYGPLVFAKPIESREIVTKIFPVEPFRDFAYLPVKKIDYLYSDKTKPVIKSDPDAGKNKFWKRISMKTILVNEQTGKSEEATLYPMGGTILRQVTFKQFSLPPAWAASAIWYQIFVERFYNGDKSNDPTPESINIPSLNLLAPPGWKVTPWTHNWFESEEWAKQSGKPFNEMLQYRRFGGDLQGVLDKLDYLQELDITALYMNPLNDAPSLHKYDPRYYNHIDVNFGPDPKGDNRIIAREKIDDPSTWQWTSADKLFLKLVAEAHKRNIRIIMDYSWNHTGVMFPVWQDILKNQEKSVYKDWYAINSWDNPGTPANEFSYTGWAGVENLPELKKVDITTKRVSGYPYEGNINEGAKRHIFAVTKRWLAPDGDTSKGIDGFRLDVADQIGMGFWRDYRKFVRSIQPDAYLVGEIWWAKWPDKLMDPVPYLKGDIFDAVMFYQVYKPARYFFAKNNYATNAQQFKDSLEFQWKRLPVANRYAMMNTGSSHDSPRLLSDFFNPNKYKFNASPYDDRAYKTGKPDSETYQRVQLYLVHLFTSIGAPHIWNGEEMGMWGADDPHCRKPLMWKEYSFEPETRNNFQQGEKSFDSVGFNQQQFNWYKKLIQIRKENPPLVNGEIEFIVADGKKLAYRRFDKNSEIRIYFNLEKEPQIFPIPEKTSAIDLLTGKNYSGNNFSLNPMTSAVLKMVPATRP
ncbi:MAG: alpha-amylase family glycosyl hydrolase [Bacteroidota bacterium]